MPFLKLKQTILRGLKPTNGFTLIELVVVITLICLMLFIAVPRLQSTLLLDNTKKVSRWFITTARVLKESAVQRQEHYVLHVSLDFNKAWATHTSMSENDVQEALQKSFQLPEDVKLIDVEYPGGQKVYTGQADIGFYRQGYSDMAIIHIEGSNSEQLSYLIEPFLPGVKLYEKYLSFEN